MTVRELNRNQLDELRDSLYWIWLDEGRIDVDKFDGITNEELFEYCCNPLRPMPVSKYDEDVTWEEQVDSAIISHGKNGWWAKI